MKQKFLDPLYGPIELNDKSMRAAFSPDFQRLRYIRLCNINSLFITGASEPNRFEHCIGVCHLADIWASEKKLSPKEADTLRAAALLHDLATGPFGHSMQYVLEDNPAKKQFKHSDLAANINQQFLQLTKAGQAFAGKEFEVVEVLGELAPAVFETIDGKGPLGPLIAGTLDLDNLDNVVRLAFHMGICSESDRKLPLKLTPLLDTHDSQLAVPSKAVPLLQQWFEIRKKLYEYLLLDRGEFSAKAMLTLSVEKAIDAGIIGPDKWILTDHEILYDLEKSTVGQEQEIKRHIQRLRIGDLFNCVDVWETTHHSIYEAISSAAEKRRIEKEIETEVGSINGKKLNVCLHLILDRKKTCRALAYWDTDRHESRVVGYDSKKLLLGVFISNALSEGISDQVRKKYDQGARTVFQRLGLDDLKPAPAPLEIFHEPQKGLFDL